MIPADKLTRWRDLAEAATAGPWTSGALEIFDADGENIASANRPSIYSSDACLANARFIAAANPSTVLELLAEVDLLAKHETHVNEEYQTMKDVLRAEHAECKRLRALALEAVGIGIDLLNDIRHGVSTSERLREIRKLAGGTP